MIMKIDDRWCWLFFLIENFFSYFEMGKNKDRKKKGAAVQKTATKAKKKTEKELKKQIEQLGEVKFIVERDQILEFFI
jgi:hypothetical protein